MPEAASAEGIRVLREEFRTHEQNDRHDFAELRRDIATIINDLSQWRGAMVLAKWALGLGVPSILGAVITHVVRHW